MSDWIRCNSCLGQPSATLKFFLTSCGHIFCKSCVDKGAVQPSCKACGQQARLLEINRQMKPDMQLFFLDAEDVVKRQTKQFQQILRFQAGHRNRCVKLQQQQATRIKQTLSYYNQEMKRVSELEKQNKALMAEVQRLQQNQSNLKTKLKQIMSARGAITPNVKMSAPENQYRHRLTPNTTRTPGNATPMANPLLMSFETPGNQHFPCTLGSNPDDRTVTGSPSMSEITTPKMLGFGGQSKDKNNGPLLNPIWQQQSSGGHESTPVMRPITGVATGILVGSQLGRQQQTKTPQPSVPFNHLPR